MTNAHTAQVEPVDRPTKKKTKCEAHENIQIIKASDEKCKSHENIQKYKSF